jgi:hypothetical protein
MNSMDNFFNYISKPINKEDIDTWFKINNILPEKLELYYDFSYSLYDLIKKTFLGEEDNSETKIKMSEEDIVNHFKWCWNKTIDNFGKEGIFFTNEGKHYEYFVLFFIEIFYNQNDKKIKESIGEFFDDIFSIEKTFTQSDLDIMLNIYKSLDNNLTV